jgi:hypothetical protein
MKKKVIYNKYKEESQTESESETESETGSEVISDDLYTDESGSYTDDESYSEEDE